MDATAHSDKLPPALSGGLPESDKIRDFASDYLS
jgi:hypothetical protein